MPPVRKKQRLSARAQQELEHKSPMSTMTSSRPALLLPGAIYRDQLLEKVTGSTTLHKDLSNVVCDYMFQPLIVSSTNGAFAAVLASGRVVTWGDADYGGDSSSVQAELKDQVVQHIYSTHYAFAAVLASGRVVTWGDADFGGDSISVQAELKDQVVQHIYSCLLYTSPSPRDVEESRMPSSA